ncbi:MAG: hypothetical protein JST16_08920 [Bdellovibrionales bacterium]|nr:hypothetical protein [Bdellovibrionales bacterium]
MTDKRTQAELLRSRALQLRRETIEPQSTRQPRFIKWILGKYLAFATRGVEEALKLEEKVKVEELDRIEVERVRESLRRQAIGADRRDTTH